LSITESAVSQQIKSLEAELGCRLFNRIGPRKELTPDGKIFLELITPIVHALDALRTTFDDLKGHQTGELTIAATTVVIMGQLPDVIKKFKKKHPGIRLSILEHRWNEVVSLAEAGEIDFGIAPVRTIPANLRFLELEPCDRVLIVNPGHPLAAKSRVTPADIAQYPMIAYERGLIHRSEFDRVFKKAGLNIHVVMEATNAETMIRYVEMDIGVAIIPKIALLPKRRDRVKAIPVSDHFGKSQYGIILRKGKYVTSWARDFLRMLDPAIGELDPPHTGALKRTGQ
jgi:DNA-binding transcriptional LysR family regulator